MHSLKFPRKMRALIFFSYYQCLDNVKYAKMITICEKALQN